MRQQGCGWGCGAMEVKQEDRNERGKRHRRYWRYGQIRFLPSHGDLSLPGINQTTQGTAQRSRPACLPKTPVLI